MDTGKDAQGMAGCPGRGWGVGLEGLTPEQSHGNRCFKSAPPLAGVWCARGRTAGEGVWARAAGPGVSNSAKRMLSEGAGWQGRRV